MTTTNLTDEERVLLLTTARTLRSLLAISHSTQELAYRIALDKALAPFHTHLVAQDMVTQEPDL